MAISYNGLWKLLIDKDMKKGDLCKSTGLSSSTMAKMTNGESVNLSVLERICEKLDCDFADLVNYKKHRRKLMRMSNDKISDVGINIAEKATVIWNVADMLRGPFKPHEYGLVILPMTVVKRFHDCLLPTHDNVLVQYKKVKT